MKTDIDSLKNNFEILFKMFLYTEAKNINMFFKSDEWQRYLLALLRDKKITKDFYANHKLDFYPGEYKEPTKEQLQQIEKIKNKFKAKNETSRNPMSSSSAS